MNVDSLTEVFEERFQEIDAYLNLLDALERQAHAGPPMIGGGLITVQQQKILYSAVYLQLYNLVEATVTWCLDAVCAAAAQDGRWLPSDLSEELRREWVRTTAQTHAGLNADRVDEAAAVNAPVFHESLRGWLHQPRHGGVKARLANRLPNPLWIEVAAAGQVVGKPHCFGARGIQRPLRLCVTRGNLLFPGFYVVCACCACESSY